MKMGEIAFDPFDTGVVPNPKLPGTPLRFNAWEHIGQVVYLDPRRVKPMRGQPRDDFKLIAEIGQSIASTGQETTIGVFPIKDPEFDVELTAGERRMRGCRLEFVAVRAEIKRPPPNRQRQMLSAIVENCNRMDLTLSETVKAVAQLLEDDKSPEQISVIMGKTRAWVDQFINLTKLTPQVLAMLAEERGAVQGESGRKLRRKSVLPLTIALEVAKLPASDQFAFSQMLIEEGVQIESARDMVKHRLREAGLDVPRVRSPKERFDVLGRECHRFEVLIARYLQSTPEELLSMARGNENDRCDAVVRKLRIIAKELESLAAHFAGEQKQGTHPQPQANELPGPKFTPWTWHPSVQSVLVREVFQDLLSGKLRRDE